MRVLFITVIFAVVFKLNVIGRKHKIKNVFRTERDGWVLWKPIPQEFVTGNCTCECCPKHIDPPPRKCANDIVIAVDSSACFRDNHKSMIVFLRDLTQQIGKTPHIQYGGDETRLAIMQFNGKINFELELSSFKNYTDPSTNKKIMARIRPKIMQMPFRGGGSFLNVALNATVNHILSHPRPKDILKKIQPSTPRPIVILLSNGKSHTNVTMDDIESSIAYLVSAGVTVLPISVARECSSGVKRDDKICPDPVILNKLAKVGRPNTATFLEMKSYDIETEVMKVLECSTEVSPNETCSNDCSCSCEPLPIGPKGSNGTQGMKGDFVKGEPGVKGDKGAKGLHGLKGNKGTKGEKGIGEHKGDIGPKGDKGEVGVIGDQGDGGIKGVNGIKGRNGDLGVSGENGTKGYKGVKGRDCENGRKGQKGEIGRKGDPGQKGEIGDAGSKGERGDKIPGNHGDKGNKGMKGEKGMKGNTSDKGETGEPGCCGKPGSMGEPGVPGPLGIDGRDGAPGSPGGPGQRGSLGFAGKKGELGQKGSAGDSGIVGFPGRRGPKGRHGLRGPKGEKGESSDVSGQPGYQGIVGDMGADGNNGAVGITGPQGPLGRQGPRGIQGDRGPPGNYDLVILRPIIKKIVRELLPERCRCNHTVCHEYPIDITFLIDGSDSIASEDFEKIKTWILQTINAFHPAERPLPLNVNVVQYSDVVMTEIQKSVTNSTEIEEMVRGIQQMGSGTKTYTALQFVNDRVFPQMRSGSFKILITMTDGKSNDKRNVQLIAQSRRNFDSMFAVGVGDKVNTTELADFSKTGKVFSVENFDDLEGIISQFVDHICSDIQNVSRGSNEAHDTAIDVLKRLRRHYNGKRGHHHSKAPKAS